MFTIDELSKKIADYRDGQISFRIFQDWFEDNSAGAYAVGNLRNAYAGIEAALAEYYYDGIGEDGLKQVLANAVRPFVKEPKIELADLRHADLDQTVVESPSKVQPRPLTQHRGIRFRFDPRLARVRDLRLPVVAIAGRVRNLHCQM